jgi:hypothetical protein
MPPVLGARVVCDFRNIIGVKLDGIKIDCVPSGHFISFVDCKNSNHPAGLVHIGATGCGIYYYDGSQFYADITYQCGLPECEFIVDGRKEFFGWAEYGYANL